MSYEVILSPDAQSYLRDLDDKSRRIVKSKLKALEEEPYPRPNRKSEGDIEKVTVNGEEVYRMHISRCHTAFYIVREEDVVNVVDIVSIDKAHKMYD